MSEQELKELIDTVELKKMSFDGHEFEMEFENGISVTVGKSIEYDCTVWDLDSSIEKENRRIEWENRDKEEKNRIAEFEKNRDRIKSKFTTEEWEEIEQAFLYNNGMTFKQNMERQKDQQQFYKSMYEKYGVEGGFGQFIEKITTS